MAEFKKYGMARLIWGTRVRHEFDGSNEAVEWYYKVTKGWRKHFVSSAMIYNDEDCTDKIMREFDMFGFECDVEDYGFHFAYDWANEGKYGRKGMPEILKRPKPCKTEN